jgi:cytochrome c556
MRLQLKLTVLAAAALGVVYLGTAAADDADKLKDIKGCMAFQGKLRKEVPDLLKAKNPDWDKVQKESKDWVAMADTLGKQKPPRGTHESWKRQTDKYLGLVKDVDAAAQNKDLDAMKKSMATIGMSCGGCHSQHKPKKN